MPEAAHARHCHSRSSIEFTRGVDGVTVVARRSVAYPLHVTRPFLLAEQPAGMATLYLQSVSGGLYGGDDVELRLHCGHGAAAHVTTQGPGIVHDTRGEQASQAVHLVVGDGGFLEYLPEPSLMFPGASLNTSIDAQIGEDSVLMIEEGLLGHDPEHQARPFAHYASSISVRNTGGRLLLLDRLRMDGARHVELLAASDGHAACQATLYCLQRRTPCENLLAVARAALATHDGVHGGASTLPDEAGVVVRMMAGEADLLAAARLAAWRALRTLIAGSAPAVRRK